MTANPKTDLGFEFECSCSENLVISNLSIDVLYHRIVQSWFASIPSLNPQAVLNLNKKL